MENQRSCLNWGTFQIEGTRKNTRTTWHSPLCQHPPTLQRTNENLGPIHTGRGAPCNMRMQIIEHTVVNRSVHTGCTQHQRVCTQIGVQVCLCLLCERGLNVQIFFGATKTIWRLFCRVIHLWWLYHSLSYKAKSSFFFWRKRQDWNSAKFQKWHGWSPENNHLKIAILKSRQNTPSFSELHSDWKRKDSGTNKIHQGQEGYRCPPKVDDQLKSLAVESHS